MTSRTAAAGAAVVWLLVLAMMAGCQETSKDSSGPELFIVLSPVPGECVVRSEKRPCSEVPSYLRETLKLPLDTFIAVSSPHEATIDAIQPIIEALTSAGYTSVIGDIPLPSKGS